MALVGRLELLARAVPIAEGFGGSQGFACIRFWLQNPSKDLCGLLRTESGLDGVV